MIAKEDKDKQIEYLKNTLADVSKMLVESCFSHDYNDYEVEVDCIESKDLLRITDFIDKRLIDVTYKKYVIEVSNY